MEHDILSKDVLSINFLITDSYSFVQMRKVMTVARNDNFHFKETRGILVILPSSFLCKEV